MILEDSAFSGITALVLTYLWTKSPSAGLIVTDSKMPSAIRSRNLCHFYIGHLGMLSLVFGINVKLSSSSFQWYLR